MEGKRKEDPRGSRSVSSSPANSSPEKEGGEKRRELFESRERKKVESP